METLRHLLFGINKDKITLKNHFCALSDYQQEIFDKEIEFYETNESSYISMACGIGKTIILFNYLDN
jgi:superfamily II DNA or RNA helicase